MTLKRIETITLFDAAWAAMAMGQPCGKTWYLDSRWSFVNIMLAWLQNRGDLDASWRDGENWCVTAWPDGAEVSAEGAELPTALARLVVLVREREVKA